MKAHANRFAKSLLFCGFATAGFTTSVHLLNSSALADGMIQEDRTLLDGKAELDTTKETEAEKEALAVPLSDEPDMASMLPRPARQNLPVENGKVLEASSDLGAGVWGLKPQPSLAAHVKPVGSLAFSPDGTLVASSSWRDNAGTQISDIVLQSVTSGQVLQRLEGHWESEWNGKGPKPPWIGHWGKVNSVSFSPDGASIVSGGEDGRVALWDVQSGKALKSLPKMERPVVALCWASATTIRGLSRDGKLTTWNTQDHRTETLPLGNSNSGDWVRVGAFSNDGQKLATGDASGGLSFWNSATGSLIRKVNNSVYQNFEQPQGVETTALAFSPDSKLLMSANHAHVYLNTVEKDSDARDYNSKLFFAGQRVRQVAFAPDSQTAVAVGDSKVFILNPLVKMPADARLGEVNTGGKSVTGMAVSPRQDVFASGSTDGSVTLWK